jgi:hypothetical protein
MQSGCRSAGLGARGFEGISVEILLDFRGIFGKKSKSIGKILIKLTRAPMIISIGAQG